MATKLTAFPVLSGQDLLTNSSTQTMPIGAYMETADGRGYRYAKNGAVATVAGKVYQSSALDATNLQPSGGLGVAAQAIGDTQVTISSSITLTANQLAGGYLSVDVTPGQGYLYRIAGNTAVSGAVGAVIYLEDPLLVALTTSSKVIVTKHPYDGVVIEPGTRVSDAEVGSKSNPENDVPATPLVTLIGKSIVLERNFFVFASMLVVKALPRSTVSTTSGTR